MKYCTHCGKELLDEAVVCSGCGCPVNADGVNNSSEELDETKIQKYKIKNKKTVIMAIAAICVAVALVFASIFIFNSIRANKIMEELSGERFEYNALALREFRKMMRDPASLETPLEAKVEDVE